jgi:hypothetical protein
MLALIILLKGVCWLDYVSTIIGPAHEDAGCYGIWPNLKDSNWTCLCMMVVILMEGAAQDRRWVKSLYMCGGSIHALYKSFMD